MVAQTLQLPETMEVVVRTTDGQVRKLMEEMSKHGKAAESRASTREQLQQRRRGPADDQRTE